MYTTILEFIDSKHECAAAPGNELSSSPPVSILYLISQQSRISGVEVIVDVQDKNFIAASEE